MHWLYLHLPQLQLDHYRAASPAATPMALSLGTPPLIHQACPVATAHGIRPGQALATAQALCPSLQVRPDNSDHQERLLLQIAQLIDQHTAPLSLYKPDGLLINGAAMEKLYGDITALRQQVWEQTRRLSLQCQTGTGLTPRMARLLARHHQRPGQDSHNQTPEQMLSALAALPVSAAQWPAKTTERLLRMGLRTLGDVMAQNRGELTRRFGQALVEDLQLIRGERADPQITWQPPVIFDQHLELMQEIHNTSALAFPLQRLVQALTDFLRLRQSMTDSLLLVLRHPDEPATRLRLHTTEAGSNSAAFMELIRLRLERLTLNDSVTALRLRATRLLPLTSQPGDLFSATGPRQHQTPLLVRLGTRLGENRVQQLSLHGDHRPEHAWQWLSIPHAHKHKTMAAPNDLPPRPLWLLPQPLPLGQTPVRWLSGPERIQTGWWDQQPVQRDYYTGRFADGATGWLFRAPGGSWFVHGWFG